MSNLARKIQETEARETHGVVIRAMGATFLVRTDLGDLDAKRAVSCLVAPELHDEVLVSVLGDGRAYVLAVLEREAGARTRLVFEGDVDLSVPRGKLDLRASEGVAIASGKAVEVTSATMSLRALSGEVVMEALSYVGDRLRAEVTGIKAVASSLDTVLDRFSQKVKRSYRTVEEVDHVRAKELHYAAQETLYLSGANAVVTAEALVKVDGEQIHLGDGRRAGGPRRRSRMFANTQMGGMDLAFPDICKTPPIALPLPYPDIGLGPLGVPAVYNVLFFATPAHNLLTTIPVTFGDTPGLMLGLISQTVMASSRAITGAFTVLVGGIPATRLTSVNLQNLFNTVGMRIVPSQFTVLILAP